MPSNKNDELILVIKADVLFREGKWQGLKTDNLESVVNLIKQNAEFKRRGDMEGNPLYQQVVSYVLFSFKDKFFAYRYIKEATQKRLINKNYQLGIGGHINPVDGEAGDILDIGMMREWNEEVDFKGKILSKKLVGIVKDETTSVEEDHVGLVYHFVGDSPDIKIKETDRMEGMLIDLKDLSADKTSSSPWMKIIYEQYLLKLKNV